jgi:hypothetical protein
VKFKYHPSSHLAAASDEELATWHQECVRGMEILDGYDDLGFSAVNSLLVRIEAEQDRRAKSERV